MNGLGQNHRKADIIAYPGAHCGRGIAQSDFLDESGRLSSTGRRREESPPRARVKAGAIFRLGLRECREARCEGASRQSRVEVAIEEDAASTHARKRRRHRECTIHQATINTIELPATKSSSKRQRSPRLCRPGISLDSSLGTFDMKNVLKENHNVEFEETRFRGCGRSPKGD